ncbi:MAG: hypothetical protein IT372_30600, partial [Polyangiaceae bacterium]|nr:hypothetical protein [Polyangiaceae bacterium]
MATVSLAGIMRSQHMLARRRRSSGRRPPWTAALVLLACVLAVTARADVPPPPGPILPVCPAPGAAPSPLPPDLPA